MVDKNSNARTSINVFGSKKYVVSEDTLYNPVDSAEVDEYLKRKGRMLLGRNAILHFLYRVRVTLSTHESSVLSLKQSIESLNNELSKVQRGTSSSLLPVEVLRYASAEEVAQVVGSLNRKQLQALSKYVEEARGVHRALLADLERVRSAAGALINNPNIDAHARTEFIRLLNELPADPAPVKTPHALDLAIATGMVETNEPVEEQLGLPGDSAELNTKLRRTNTLYYYNSQPTPTGA